MRVGLIQINGGGLNLGSYGPGGGGLGIKKSIILWTWGGLGIEKSIIFCGCH